MERTSRLRRYQRKDYTQLVDFPVEIVGRDGQVRRYSYDASVRLYQRRIRSAPIRYDDAELIAAESRHCRQRIDQLRRSFVERNGWGAVRDGAAGGLLATPLAAEVVSFLRRVSPVDIGPAGLSAPLSGDGQAEVRCLRLGADEADCFLYLWRLDGPGAVAAKEEWRACVRRLSQAPAGAGVERLFVIQEGPDLAIVLSGTGRWTGPAVGGPAEEGGLVEEAAFAAEEADPWAAGQRALHEGAVAEAVRILEQGMEWMPLRSTLSQSAALLALLDNQPDRAEYAARFGVIGHPRDPLLTYLLGVAVARQGRVPEARALMTRGSSAVPSTPHLALLRAILRVERGNLPGGLIALLGIPAGVLITPAERARRGLLTLFLPLASALGMATVAGAGWAWASAGSAVRLASGLGLLMAILGGSLAVILLRVRAVRILAGAAPAEGRLVSLELLPREREPEGGN